MISKLALEYAIGDFAEACGRAGGRPVIAPDRQDCLIEHDSNFVHASMYPRAGRMWIRFGQKLADKSMILGTADVRGVKTIDALTDRIWIFSDQGTVTLTREGKVHLDV